ncbi:unnamed protein product [Diplocarpon coronariae]|uniref:C2H2-type domain-containing protein n=1 Tax=Diplocarpon coronariae TaxID=2795749 RepID=A0A218YWM3_9HELO|nr:hypothetical protein B2J93_6918 [Marssonina coronariae]
MTITPQLPGQAWGRWTEQNNIHLPYQASYAMEISYDSRAVPSASIPRSLMTPPYPPTPTLAPTFSGGSNYHMVAAQQQLQQLQSHHPFAYHGYAGVNSNLVPALVQQNINFIQQRPLPRLVETDHGESGMFAYERAGRPGYVVDEPHSSPSQPIKSESMWLAPTAVPGLKSSKASPRPSPPQEGAFATEVDVLMKAIQAKSQTPRPPTSPAQRDRSMDDGSSRSPKSSKKRYQCTIDGCNSLFTQKTHLEIHERKHTGLKPYPCKWPDCGRWFSQHGNLKTHFRLHTGERPFPCDVCGKTFPSRGNLRAHKITHNRSKLYHCRLDDCCGKEFTTRGNLKAHINKFHKATMNKLTAKFESIEEVGAIPAADRELWEYFADLFKYSNQGIKGRGTNNKVGSGPGSGSGSGSHPPPRSLSSSMRGLVAHPSPNPRGGAGYGGSAPGRGALAGCGPEMRVEGSVPRYETWDGSDSGTSYCGSGCGTPSSASIGTCYDDAPSDGFEEPRRGPSDLAFDGMY